MRADGENRYVSEFEVYTGKKGDQVEKGLGGGVVRRLTYNILNRNHQAISALALICQFVYSKMALMLVKHREQTD